MKNILLFIPLTFVINPFYKLFYFLSNFNTLILWIWKNKNEFEQSDYFTLIKNYTKRTENFAYVLKTRIKNEPVTYLEYGVAGGTSFKWWLEHNINENSSFHGFDTFEGLPESWGSHYEKGAMSFKMPDISDTRAKFYKGVFQKTLIPFIENNKDLLSSAQKKIIHLDADLYSSTLFTLSQLYPYLQPGDIVMFDEFNVANHEFRAFLDFTRSFYVHLKPITAVNNFYQVAFEVV